MSEESASRLEGCCLGVVAAEAEKAGTKTEPEGDEGLCGSLGVVAAEHVKAGTKTGPERDERP